MKDLISIKIESLRLEFHERKPRNQKTCKSSSSGPLFSLWNNKNKNTNTNISNKSMQKPHEARDQNRNHKPRRRTHEPMRRNPQTQAQTKHANMWFLGRRFRFPSIYLIFLWFLRRMFCFLWFLRLSSWQNRVSHAWVLCKIEFLEFEMLVF